MKIIIGIILAILFVGIIYIIGLNYEPYKPDKLEKSSHQLFEMINEERTGSGLPALLWNDILAAMAKNHSLWMAETDNYTHSGYPYAENIMIGCDPEDVFKSWKESYWHNVNMMDSSLHYGAIGMGIILDEYESDNVSIIYGSSRGFTTFLASSWQPIDN